MGRVDRAVAITLASLTLGILLLGAIGAWYAGQTVGAAIGEGYTFDWYVHSPGATIPAATAAATVAGLAGLLGVLAAAATLAAVHAAWDVHARRGAVDVPRHPKAAARSVAAVPALLAALVLPVAEYAWMAARPDVPWGPTLAAYVVPVAVASVVVAVLAAAAYATWRLWNGRTLPRGQGTNLVGVVTRTCARYAKTTVALVLVGTLLVGSGVTKITTDVDVADVLPRGDHNATAAKNLTTKFKSAFTQQVTFQFRTASLDVYERANDSIPNRVTRGHPANISDEVYVRALYEASNFVKDHPDSPFVGSVGLPDFYRLINWTMAGGNDAGAEAFSIPGPAGDPAAETRFAAVDAGVWSAIPQTALAVVGVDRDQTAIVFNVDPQETMSSKEIGERALRIRDEYVRWAENTPSASKVFTGDNPPLFSVDLPLANAHSSELAAKDLGRLIPPIAGFILVCLFIAFRHPGSIFVAFTALVISNLWAFGAMGHMGIALNTLNLTLVPLIMGVGIDYGIHMVNEFQEQRSRGARNDVAWAHVGSHGGLSLLLGTLTTLGGLAVMVVGPSLLISQLGLLSLIAMAVTWTIAVTYIPAGISIVARDATARNYRPSPLMAGLARQVARQRLLVAFVVVVVAAASAVAAARIGKEEFGDPPRNWLADDPLRIEHETALEGYYGTDEVKANVLVFEGDILDPDAHAYMDAIEESLKDPSRDRVFHDRIRTLPFLVRTYLTVAGGAPGVGKYLLVEQLIDRDVPGAEAQDPYPRTREEMSELMDEVFASPLYEFGNLFVDHPDERTAIMLVTVRARSYEDAEEVWRQVWSAVEENEDLRPPGMKVAFVGNTATNYLFIAKELPWVGYMSIAATSIVVLLVALTTRSVRSTITVGALSATTGLVWLAILPSLGIGLAITLTLPLVFIFAIGSDYGLHLSASVTQSKDVLETFRTTGKAVLFSFVTTFGAFLIYTQVSNLAVRRTMIATTVATVVIFVMTLLIVPMMYGTKKYLHEGPKEPATPVEVAPRASREVVAVRDAD